MGQGELQTDRRIIEEQLDGDIKDDLCGNIVDSICYLQGLRAKYSNYKDLKLSIEDYYEGNNLRLIGVRDETDEEYKERIAQVLKKQEQAELRKIKRLQRAAGQNKSKEEERRLLYEQLKREFES